MVPRSWSRRGGAAWRLHQRAHFAGSIGARAVCIHANSHGARTASAMPQGGLRSPFVFLWAYPPTDVVGLRISISCRCAHMHACMCAELGEYTFDTLASSTWHGVRSRVLALPLASFSADPPFPPGISCLFPACSCSVINPYLVTTSTPVLK